MKRVLVTGAGGFVGRHVLPALTGRGWETHAVSSHAGHENGSSVVWHRANLFDPHEMTSVVRSARATHLLHLAWSIVPGRWASAPENFEWVQASLELVRAFVDQGGTRIVATGSCLEYDWTYGYCSESRTPCVPHTFYGSCKHALQILVSAFAANRGVSSAWARLFNLYGPHEHPDRLVAVVVRSLLAEEPARCSDGNQIRDYMFAGDAASALVALLESDVTGPINVASGQPTTVREIALRLGALVGRSDLLHFGAIPRASTDLPLVVADITRLTEALRWRPQHDLEAGLTRTIAWWREQLRRPEIVGPRP